MGRLKNVYYEQSESVRKVLLAGLERTECSQCNKGRPKKEWHDGTQRLNATSQS